MKVISHKRLVDFYAIHSDAKYSLERLYDIVSHAEWKNFSDIRSDFPDASYTGNQHYVFNIKHNDYRLVVVMKFTPELIFIRWVGTHADYDRIDCSTI